jgi:hypothetical protein
VHRQRWSKRGRQLKMQPQLARCTQYATPSRLRSSSSNESNVTKIVHYPVHLQVRKLANFFQSFSFIRLGGCQAIVCMISTQSTQVYYSVDLSLSLNSKIVWSTEIDVFSLQVYWIQ